MATSIIRWQHEREDKNKNPVLQPDTACEMRFTRQKQIME